MTTIESSTTPKPGRTWGPWQPFAYDLRALVGTPLDGAPVLLARPVEAPPGIPPPYEFLGAGGWTYNNLAAALVFGDADARRLCGRHWRETAGARPLVLAASLPIGRTVPIGAVLVAFMDRDHPCTSQARIAFVPAPPPALERRT